MSDLHEPVPFGTSQRSAHERGVTLFWFVSLTQALVLAEVFPVIYKSAQKVWTLWGALKHAGPANLLVGYEWRPLTVPYIDALGLVLVLLVVWFAYYYLILNIRRFAAEPYSYRLAVWDIGVAVVLYCTAASLGNLAGRALPHTDTAWFGLLIACTMFAFRAILGSIGMADPWFEGDSDDARLQFMQVQEWQVSCLRLTTLFLVLCGILSYRATSGIYELSSIGTFERISQYCVWLSVGIGLIAWWVVYRREAELKASMVGPAESRAYLSANWLWIWRRERWWFLGWQVVLLLAVLVVAVRHESLSKATGSSISPWPVSAVVLGLLFIGFHWSLRGLRSLARPLAGTALSFMPPTEGAFFIRDMMRIKQEEMDRLWGTRVYFQMVTDGLCVSSLTRLNAFLVGDSKKVAEEYQQGVQRSTFKRDAVAEMETSDGVRVLATSVEYFTLDAEVPSLEAKPSSVLLCYAMKHVSAYAAAAGTTKWWGGGVATRDDVDREIKRFAGTLSVALAQLRENIEKPSSPASAAVPGAKS